MTRPAMTRHVMLIGALAMFIVVVSVWLAPVAQSSANVQAMAFQPTAIHSLTGVAFHTVAAGF